MKAHGIELRVGQVWNDVWAPSIPSLIKEIKKGRIVTEYTLGEETFPHRSFSLRKFTEIHDRILDHGPAGSPQAEAVASIDATIDRVAPLPPNPKQAYGAQKPDLSLIPPVALAHAALAFENGAAKYGPFNWREKAVEARTYIAAAQRHIGDFSDRTDRASDSDVHNLGHAIACLAILLDCQEQGNLIDNRPIKGQSAEVLERLKEWKKERAK